MDKPLSDKPDALIFHPAGQERDDIEQHIISMARSLNGEDQRLRRIDFTYDLVGTLESTAYFFEPTPSTLNDARPATSSTKPPRVRKRAASKSAPKPPRPAESSPRQRDQGRVRMGRNGDLAKFIATLPEPRKRPDLKGTRWSYVAIKEWLPDGMSSGSRQTRSKALNPLIRAGVLNVSELRNMRVSELLALPGMGEGGVTYLARELAYYGLRFKPEPKRPAKG